MCPQNFQSYSEKKAQPDPRRYPKSKLSKNSQPIPIDKDLNESLTLQLISRKKITFLKFKFTTKSCLLTQIFSVICQHIDLILTSIVSNKGLRYPLTILVENKSEKVKKMSNGDEI